MPGFSPIKFFKGLRQKPTADTTDGLVQCQGLSFEKTGSLRAAKADDTTINYSATVHSLGFVGLASPGILLAGAGSALKRGPSTLRTYTKQKMDFASHSGRAYITNDVDGMFVYEGTTPMFKCGATIPTTQAAATTVGSGSFTGAYNIKVTFVNQNGFESNANASVVVGGASSSLINVSSIPTNSNASYDINSRKIYIQGGTDPFYSDYVHIKTLSDNTAATVDGLDTSDVDTSTILETDNNPPPDFKQIEEHYGVIFGAGHTKNFLRFSKTNKAEQYPTANSILVSESNDPIQKIIKWNDSFWVVTRETVFEIIGSPGSGDLVTNFFPKDTQSQYGTTAVESVVPTPYGLFFQSEIGFMVFDGQRSQIFSNDIQDFWDARNENDNPESRTIGGFHDDKLIYSVASGTSEHPNKLAIYDFREKTWSTDVGSYRSFASDRRNNILHAGTSTGINRFRNGSSYRSWVLQPQDLITQIDSYGAWGKFQLDLEGSATAEVYLDGVLSNTHSLSQVTRGFVTRRFPLGLAHRAHIVFSNDASDTQDKIFSLGYSGVLQRGQV